MTHHDQDGVAIAAVEKLVQKANAAQAGLSGFSQQDVDRVCERMARLGFESSNRLAMMAVEETGIGIVRQGSQERIRHSHCVEPYQESSHSRIHIR